MLVIIFLSYLLYLLWRLSLDTATVISDNENAKEWQSTPSHINFDSRSKNRFDEIVVKDSNGNILKDGDSVTIIKGLKVKGSSSGLKVGTKVKNIRLVEGDHDIDCKVPGIGAMKLKSQFVKKVTD